MQDRFKFRAWDKQEKILVYEAEKTYDFMVGKPYPIENDTFGDLLDDDRYIVEQCTGLKDKNGKLIYEGDIVKQGGHIYKVIFSYENVASCGCCVPAFDGCGFVIENEWGRGDLTDNSLEVIGNIHENPELLEKSDEI